MQQFSMVGSYMEGLKKQKHKLSKLKGGRLRRDEHLPGDNMVHHYILQTQHNTYMYTCDITIHTTHMKGLILTDLTSFRPGVNLDGHR